MKIGVTGASGFVGSHLVESLSKNENEVTCLLRKTSNDKWINQVHCNTVLGSLFDKDSLRAFVSDKDAIIHCAGITKAAKYGDFYSVNVTGTDNVLKAIVDFNKKLGHFIFISSQEVAGEFTEDVPINETKPIHPVTMYGKTKAEAENIVLRHKDRFPVTILRPSPVYGPRDKDILTFFRMVYRGKEPRFPIDNKISVVYVENLVCAISKILFNSKTYNKTYYVADDGHFSWSEMAQFIAKVVGVKTKPVFFPWWMIKIAGFFAGLSSRLFGIMPVLNKEKLRMMLAKNLMVDSGALKNDIGEFSIVDIDCAVNKTYNWYKQHNWLK